MHVLEKDLVLEGCWLETKDSRVEWGKEGLRVMAVVKESGDRS